jgi:polyisoprenyl-teichoic acid--peptidoglycan teichoic acid transferase
LWEESLQTSQERHEKQLSVLFKIVVLLFISLFVCGALFFGYQVFDTVREAVITFGLPDVGSLPVLSAAPPPEPERLPNLSAGERVNVLLLGIDRRPSEKCPCRTDTMILASLDPKTLTAGAVTIPRDLFVPIPGVGESRINTAMFYGELYKFQGGGPGLAKKTVEYNLGRRVHYYVLIDFAGFRKAIDALGGIDLDIPKPIYDPCYPDENFNCAPLNIPAGRVHLNGDMALKYARTRHQDGDFGRSKRQIQVLMEARNKALRLDLLPKLPAMMQSMWGTVETDLQPQEVLALAQVAAKVKTDGIKSGTIDQSMTVEYRTNTGADVLWFDRSKVGQLIDQVIPQEGTAVDQPNQIKTENARIIVLNGTSNGQVAERTAKYLQTQGYQISTYGNADRFDYSKTVLIDYVGNKNATVMALAKMFHIEPANARRVTDIKTDADIRIILGADWTPPQ